MKMVKFLGFAVAIAVAITAFIGVSAASAVTLCSAAENPCAAKMRYPAGTAIKGTLATGTQAVFKVESIGTIKCKGSTLAVKTSQESGSPLTGELTNITMSSCSLGSTECSVETSLLGFIEVLVSWSFPFNFNATLDGGIDFGFHCGALLKCEFTGKNMVLVGAGGEPATLKSEAIALERKGSICPTESKWTSAYEIAGPNPLYGSESP